MFGDIDSYKVLRNDKTLAAHRARMAGAQRVSMPFILLPVFLNPAIYLPVLRHWLPHRNPWPMVALMAIWLGLAVASMGYGVYRQRRYLRDHPADEGRGEASSSPPR